MQEKWEKLVSVLLEILNIYKELLGLGYQKREALVERDLKRIEEVTKQEENLIFQLAKLNGIREAVIQEISILHGLVDKKPTLSQISQLADSEILYKLKNIEQEYNKMILEMTQLNEVNKKIVQQAMLIVNCTLSLISQSKADPTYGSNQSAPPVSHNRALFDHKV
ncbi:flagellar protein FlgN [Pelosinus sp. IPA-1]|uniref:flagellar protein FlgN n=1 Tax=Pelosinus sp. IPA-1 TaxID=3029569 RepID=UPI002436280A|nr:flagellar protein FlgN [Pelosinus sp. IPA-1]GMB01686.1 hypothetical protein PIPA1_44860 [Pelosinus sp. IPA-1]